MKNRMILLFVFIIFTGQFVKSQSSGNAVIDQLMSAWSPRNFSTQPVTDQQLDLILKCGIKAPSGSNRQPWKFTVVRDTAAMKGIIKNIVPGNVLVIVSGLESKEGTTPDFDCALAIENMFIAATALGLGGRIYAGPVKVANTRREALQIPAGYKIVSILRIGNIDTNVETVSGASARKSDTEIVNFHK